MTGDPLTQLAFPDAVLAKSVRGDPCLRECRPKRLRGLTHVLVVKTT